MNVGLMILSGLLVSLSFPSWAAPGFAPWTGWLAWVALIPALIALGRMTPGRAAFAGWLGGLACWMSILYWVAVVRELDYFRIPAWFLFAAVLAGYWALWGWLVARAGPRRVIWVAPAAWVLCEWLRGWLFTGFPWTPLGASQWAVPHLFLSARFIGVLGVSAAVVAGNAVILAAIRSPESRGGAAMVAASAIAILGVLSAVARVQVALDTRSAPTLRFALLQGGFTEEEKNLLPIDILVARYEALARQAADSHPAVMVWPETAAACAIGAPGLLSRARKLAVATRSDQLVGALYEGPGGAVLNGVFRVTPRGIEGAYYKMRLVPFGEYIPGWFRKVSPVARKLIASLIDLSPGFDPAPVDLPGGARAGAEVCYEAVYAAHARRIVRAGAEVIVNVTNDAWYWRTAATWQHALGPLSRAVECGRDLVRCANTGATLAVTPDAKISCSIPLFIPGVQIVDARILRVRTGYVRWGDWPVLALAALALLLSFRRERP